MRSTWRCLSIARLGRAGPVTTRTSPTAASSRPMRPTRRSSARRMDPLQTAAAIGCGVIVGFSLGLIGGGGSVLAVPLLLYVVGMPDPHQAIGTSALAVAVSAFANLVPHARAGHVRWRPALMFAAAGLVGAFVGSSIGKIVDGHKLLILFALLMLVIAAMMLRGRKADAGVV